MMYGNSLNIFLIRIVVPSPNSRCPLPDVDSKPERCIQDEVSKGAFTIDFLKVEALSNRCKVNRFNVFTLVYFKHFRLSECKRVTI